MIRLAAILGIVSAASIPACPLWAQSPSQLLQERDLRRIEVLLADGGPLPTAWRRAPEGMDSVELRAIGQIAYRLNAVDVVLGANSARPWGWNDGALWQGRGVSTALTGGLRARWGVLHVLLSPTVVATENREVGLSPLPVPPGLGPYAYPVASDQYIDMPQRFGDRAVARLDLGHSASWAELGPIAAGLSHEHQWWGPARHAAPLMSYHAPGFGHAFVKPSRPLATAAGTLDARWFWGRLHESAFFDANPRNNTRYVTGLTASLAPAWAPGVEVGAHRVFTAAWPARGLTFRDITTVLQGLQKRQFASDSNPGGNDRADQLASIYFRWAMPRVGFELYGEWAKGDHSWDLRDLFLEPEHASGWMVGLQQLLWQSENAFWRFGVESTILGGARSSRIRPPRTAFYQHHIVRQGYTHRGQVLGAGIGPGSSQFSVQVDRFADWGRVGATFFRTVYDNDRFYRTAAFYLAHEVEPSVALDALVFRGRYDLTGSLTLSNLLNKHYIVENDELNVNLRLGLRYHFARD